MQPSKKRGLGRNQRAALAQQADHADVDLQTGSSSSSTSMPIDSCLVRNELINLCTHGQATELQATCHQAVTDMKQMLTGMGASHHLYVPTRFKWQGGASISPSNCLFLTQFSLKFSHIIVVLHGDRESLREIKTVMPHLHCEKLHISGMFLIHNVMSTRLVQH